MATVDSDATQEDIQIRVRNAARAGDVQDMLRNLEAAVCMIDRSGTGVKIKIGPGPQLGNSDVVIFKILKDGQEINVFQESRGIIVDAFIRGVLDMGSMGSADGKKVTGAPTRPFPEGNTKADRRRAKRGESKWSVVVDSGKGYAKYLETYETRKPMEAMLRGFEPLPNWLMVMKEI